MLRHLSRLSGILWIVAVLLAPGESGAVLHDISIQSFDFVPRDITIGAGDSVRWTNHDAVIHTSTSDSGVWDSGVLSPGQAYTFAFTSEGVYPYHCEVHLSMKDTITVGTSGIGEEQPKPGSFELSPNYPNPFNARTVIGYSLSQPAHVTVEVFNALGQKIETLIDERQDAGTHQVTWDAAKQNSGVYFYRLTALNQTKTGRMTLLK